MFKPTNNTDRSARDERAEQDRIGQQMPLSSLLPMYEDERLGRQRQDGETQRCGGGCRIIRKRIGGE